MDEKGRELIGKETYTESVSTFEDDRGEQSILRETSTTSEGEAHGSFFQHVMSVDETRVSVLMICLLTSLFFGGFAYIKFGDLSDNWTSLIETFTYCVTGINIIGALSTRGTKASSALSQVLGQAKTPSSLQVGHQSPPPVMPPTQR